MNIGNNRNLLPSLLIAAAIAVLVAIYYSPVWWVSLTAPNYPEEAFPDGVRIHFHMNGVFNGCQKVEKAEITEKEALDCVHEMDTINHYVGMYPIASGGVIEKAFSPFLTALLGMMLVGYLIRNPRLRLAVMGSGFLGIAVWMGLAWYGGNGLDYQNAAYIRGLVMALDQDAQKESADKDSTSEGSALVERLKQSLQKSGVGVPGSTAGSDAAATQPASNAEIASKADGIEHLHTTFQHDQERKPAGEQQTWTGSSAQMMSWHYEKSLGRYFNNPDEIRPMVKTMTIVAHLVFWGIIGAMALLLWGAWKGIRPLYWLLVLVPLALPVFFIIEYSGWLYWYGHNLNAMGAFTVKPFMPTVFGQGKVAQFTTHSYPALGFFLMLLSSALLAAAVLLRRKGGE